MNNFRDEKLPLADRHDRDLENGQLDLLFDQLPSNLLATVVVASLLTLALWNSVPNAIPSLWLVAVLAGSAWRFWLLRRYRTRQSSGGDGVSWKRQFLLAVALNGVLWGAAGAIFFVPASAVLQTLLAFSLAGLSAGAVSTLSPVRGAPALFLAPALIPYTIRLLANPGETYLIMAAMVGLFVAMMWMISRRLHATVEKSLRLRFENVELIDDLTRSRAVQDEAHRALTEQIEETQKAQRALEESHAELERRVRARTSELEELAAKLRATVAELDDQSRAAEVARSAAESASNAKSQFLAVVSHELRTPLNIIVGYHDLLAAEIAGELGETQRKYLMRAELAAQQLIRLIDQILNLARIEAGREELRIEEGELSMLTHEVAALVEPLAAKKQLRFRILVPDARVHIRTDLMKLRQILLNLLSNAIKFTDQGEVVLRAGETDGQVVFTVTDTGSGITAEDLDRIFDVFTHAATFRNGGTGLGLSVSRTLAELLGGALTVESAVAKGSEFTLRVPATMAG
jgi:signal transduction histidine kinase